MPREIFAASYKYIGEKKFLKRGNEGERTGQVWGNFTRYILGLFTTHKDFTLGVNDLQNICNLSLVQQG